ncbi:MAG: type I restriction endonuclease subunit R, partial [Armatimonadetes bacterium]|nr:type I restriction endonuclease subunit R [Armatimonadota bacterium]
MPSQHTERAFESTVERVLLDYRGYKPGNRDSFDLKRCLDPTVLVPFIKQTQDREWAYLQSVQKDDAERVLLDALCAALDSEHEGCLKVLRHGFKCMGKQFRVAYFKPASGLNPETERLYDANRLTVTRQLRYSERHTNTVDMVLSLNGLPLVTAELKNPMTGQTWRNAVYQYQHDRDPKDRFFTFKARTLVHFAVDPDEVYMTTRLLGPSTHFLPFNKGRDTGAGNPDN